MQTKSEVAADLNAKQLSQGLKNDGTKSDYPYSPLTIALKRGKPGLSGVTSYLTNYDTGESYKKLYLKVTGNEVEFGTTTDKEEAISDRMDNMAFGLTDENKTEFMREEVKPEFYKNIKAKLKL